MYHARHNIKNIILITFSIILSGCSSGTSAKNKPVQFNFPIITQPVLINKNNPKHRSLCFTDFTRFTKRKQLYLYIYNLKKASLTKKQIMDKYYQYDYRSTNKPFGIDCNGDGIEELMIVCNARIYAYDIKGDLVKGYPTKLIYDNKKGSSYGIHAIAPMDINSDGKKEILIIKEQGHDSSFDVLDLQGKPLLKEPVKLHGGFLNIQPVFLNSEYVFFIKTGKAFHHETSVMGIDLKKLKIMKHFPILIKKGKRFNQETLDLAINGSQHIIELLLKKSGTIISIDYKTGKKKEKSIPGINKAVRIASTEKLYIFDDETKSVIRLDKKHAIEKRCGLNIDNTHTLESFHVISAPGTKNNYIVCTFENKPTLSIDELYKKHGDLAEIKKIKKSQKQYLAEAKRDILNQKFGWKKLAQLRNPVCAYKVFVLTDNNQKIEIIERKEFSGYTTKSKKHEYRYSLHPIVFRNNNKKTISTIIQVNEYQAIPESKKKRKSKIECIDSIIKQQNKKQAQD
ncbi:MAG: VCBS repeat-containing protein [bacterium]|nr:VCBS repeat-containing protein [bacterium]